jgi:hypothetical protein
VHRRAREARQEYLRRLQQQISCFTPEVLRAVGPYGGDTGELVIALAGGDPVPLRESELLLTVQERVHLRQDSDTGVWSAEKTAYNYVLETESGSELLAYQLHPYGPSGFWAPHLHVGRLADPTGRLGNAHLPTGGAVDLSAVLLLAVDDLGVRPIRDDWEKVFGRGGMFGVVSRSLDPDDNDD